MRFLQLTLILGAVATGTAFAQETTLGPMLIGPTAGFMYGLDVADVPVYYTSADCGLFTRGRTLTSSLGGTLALPSFFSSDFGLLASLRFSYAAGRLSLPPSVPFRIPDSETGGLVEISTEYRLNSASLITSLDLLAGMKLSDRLSVAVGPFIGYRLSSTVSQTENILAPEEYRFPNGHKEQPMPDGPNPQGGTLLFGPSLLASYALPFGSNRFLVPGISVQTDLISALGTFSWRSYRAGLSLSLLFNVVPPPEHDSLVPDDPIPPPTPRLTASVEMYGVDEEGKALSSARIQVYETLFQRHAPLLPAIFFDRNEADLAPRYHVLDSARHFFMDELALSGLLELQHDVLNVVGFRLQERRDSRITLVGLISGDESAGLRRSRVGTVESYLENVWRIDSSRIRVREGNSLMQRSSEETEDGREDNRRVEMMSEDLSILGPVVTTRVIRDFDPPLIKMKPEFDAEAGVKEWRLIISQGGQQVAAYGNNDDEPDTAGMTWRIVHDRVDSALSPLIATLTVEDSTGAVVTATASLPLSMVRNPRVVDQHIERKGDIERLGYTLVGFEFSSAGLGAQNVQVVKEIAEIIKNGADIEVVGYTDRIGDEARNRELAMERAINVAKILQHLLEQQDVEDVTLNVSGEGAETERFDNNLPEGRVLSRGVGIVVEQQADGKSRGE